MRAARVFGGEQCLSSALSNELGGFESGLTGWWLGAGPQRRSRRHRNDGCRRPPLAMLWPPRCLDSVRWRMRSRLSRFPHRACELSRIHGRLGPCFLIQKTTGETPRDTNKFTGSTAETYGFIFPVRGPSRYTLAPCHFFPSKTNGPAQPAFVAGMALDQRNWAATPFSKPWSGANTPPVSRITLRRRWCRRSGGSLRFFRTSTKP